jgi:hypothetical protein
MSKIKVKIGKGMIAKVNKVIENLVTPDMLKASVKPLITVIKSGRDPKTGREYKSLKPATVKRRRALSAYNSTGPGYGVANPNITFTGEFLESIKAIFKAKGAFGSKSLITIKPTGTHSPYSLPRGGTTKAVSNQKIAQGLKKNGFRVFEINKKNTKAIAKTLIKLIKKKLK